MVKAVILDLWGTIAENGVNPSPSKQVRYFLRVREPFSEFITTFEHSFMKKDFESLKEGFEAVVKDFNLKIPDFVYDKMIGMWNKNAILSKMYPEVKEYIETKKAEGIKFFLLSNTDKFSFEQIKQKYELDKLFDGLYASYETGLLKSDKQAYEKILEEHKLKKEDVIMVGDSIESDIKSAESAGIKAILIDRKETREFEPKIKTLNELDKHLKGD